MGILGSALNKMFSLGSLGDITVSEAAGVVTASLSVNVSVGGGATAGALKGVINMQVIGNGTEAVDALFVEGGKLLPAMAPEFIVAKGLWDEFAKTL